MRNSITAPSSCRKPCPCLDSDDEHTLAERILEQEHIAYAEAIKIVLEGNLRLWAGGSRRLRVARSCDAHRRVRRIGLRRGETRGI